MKKKEAEEILNKCLWQKLYCPFEKGYCRIDCICFIKGEVIKKGRGFDVKYPRCTFFNTKIIDTN